MTYKQQLTDFLCTLDAIDKQIKELKMGCKVGITIQQGGCSNPSHGLTRECRYTYAPCWTKEEKIEEHTIMGKTNSTRNAIIQGNTSYGFKDNSLYFNSGGRLIFLNEEEYNNYRSKYFELLNKNPLGVFYCDKIIGNPLEYHHLMMYANIKNIPLLMLMIGEIQIGNPLDKYFKINIDNKKPLSEQSEEVYEQILIALKGA